MKAKTSWTMRPMCNPSNLSSQVGMAIAQNAAGMKAIEQWNAIGQTEHRKGKRQDTWKAFIAFAEDGVDGFRTSMLNDFNELIWGLSC